MYIDYKNVDWKEVANRLNKMTYLLKATNKEELEKRLTVDMVYGVLIGMGDALFKEGTTRVVGWKDVAKSTREWYINGHKFEEKLKK